MRVLLVNKYNHITGGADEYFFTLRRLLADRGHSVAEFCLHHPENVPSAFEEYFVSGVTSTTWQKARPGAAARALVNAVWNVDAARKFSRLLRRFRPDVIHIQNMFFQISPSILRAAHDREIPVVETLHDYHPICPSNNLFHHGRMCEDCLTEGLLSVLRNSCYNDSFRASVLTFVATGLHRRLGLYEDRIDRWIAPSRFLGERLCATGRSLSKIRFVSNTIEPATDEPPGRRATGSFLFVGRLVAHKGIMTLLRAARRLPHVVFRIAGSGPLEREVDTYVAQHRLANVERLGFVSRGEIPRLVASSTALVVPSEWYENSPMVILQAMSAGTPVIASRIGGIPEMVDDRTGLLFPPGDAEHLASDVRRLQEDHHLATSMTQASLERYQEEFSNERHYRKLLEIYEEVRSAR